MIHKCKIYRCSHFETIHFENRTLLYDKLVGKNVFTMEYIIRTFNNYNQLHSSDYYRSRKTKSRFPLN